MVDGGRGPDEAVQTQDPVVAPPVCLPRRLRERSLLERHFREAQTVRHHGFLSEGPPGDRGPGVSGVEPEFGFVAF